MEETLKLPRRPLGSTGLTVSVLGLGTVKFGRNQKIKYPAFALPEDRAICQLLDEAREFGLNLLDTAPAYGLAEERLGQLLGNNRAHFVIVTKTGEDFAHGESAYDFSAEQTRRSVERSLRRLRTDRLDCVLAHCPGNDLETLQNSPVLETLQQLKDRGDIRSFGASTNTVEGGLWALRTGDVVMVTHSAEYAGQEAVIRSAAELGKGVLIKKGLASGHLNQFNGEDPVKTALNFIFDHPGATSVVVGTINPAHLARNTEACAQASP